VEGSYAVFSSSSSSSFSSSFSSSSSFSFSSSFSSSSSFYFYVNVMTKYLSRWESCLLVKIVKVNFGDVYERSVQANCILDTHLALVVGTRKHSFPRSIWTGLSDCWTVLMHTAL
jgi:hypothetical protein